jgi:hypothetical protein
MATARAQGGLRGVSFGGKEESHFSLPEVFEWSTRVRLPYQGKVQQSQDLAPGDRVSHRMEHAEMNPYWITYYSRTSGLVSVWTCSPPHHVHYDNR